MFIGRRRQGVAAASPPRRRRVAALTPLSMWQEEAPLLPGVAFRVASRRREAPLGGVRLPYDSEAISHDISRRAP